MKTCIATLKSVTPYTMSRMHDTPKHEKEGHDEYDRRTYREKARYDDKGIAYIPGIAFKMALDDAAKFLSISVPGKGKATYTKHFKSGILCDDTIPLGVTRETIGSITINANADGVRGSGKRVKRTFPQVAAWGGDLQIYVLDDTITKDVFEKVLREAGRFIGIGQYRPQQGGTNGRFEVTKVEWVEQ